VGETGVDPGTQRTEEWWKVWNEQQYDATRRTVTVRRGTLLEGRRQQKRLSNRQCGNNRKRRRKDEHVSCSDCFQIHASTYEPVIWGARLPLAYGRASSAFTCKSAGSLKGAVSQRSAFAPKQMHSKTGIYIENEMSLCLSTMVWRLYRQSGG